MTSPKTTTDIVEIKIAKYEGTTASKQIGKVSMATAFEIRRVHSKTWWFLRMGIIFLAASFSYSVPFSNFISSCKSSIDKYPTVNPEHNPAKQTKNADINT